MPTPIDWILGLFARRLPKPAPVVPPDNHDEPARIINRNVLLLVYDPVMDPVTGATLSQQQGWQRAERLTGVFLGDLLKASGGLARYQVAQRIDIDDFPQAKDGFRYTPESYLQVLHGSAPPHQPSEVDYDAIFSEYKILWRVSTGQIDEVWAFGFPHAGFYESTMGGPGAFWCNSPPRLGTGAGRRRFVVMGFSYERGVGEMLEAYGHRVESIMHHVYSNHVGEANLWERFTRHEQRAPGSAACGTVHFAPNSTKDYEWGNPTPVPSECDDWLHNFPRFKGNIRQVDAREWGSGDIRLYQTWWLSHLPKAAGRTNGVHNNWWQYITDPSRVPA